MAGLYISGLKTALQIAGAWTDISSYVYDHGSPSSVTTTGGHGDETSQITPVQVSGQMNNRDYRFSTNPAGPYYPYFGRNTPIRMSLPLGSTYLRLAYDTVSWVQCADATALQLTGNIDVRIDVDLDDYEACTLAYKYGGAAQSWRLELQNDGTLLFTWYDGTHSHALSSTVPVPLGRVILRATLTLSTGTVTFYTGTGGSMAGSYTQLGRTATTGAATTLSAGTGQPVIVGHNAPDAGAQSLQGRVFEFQLRNASGTVVADPVFSSQTEGATSFNDAQANTWILEGTAEISGRAYIAHAEMSTLPVSWDPSGRDVWLPFQAGGVLRRLTQGNSPVLSPMRRAVLDLSASIPFAAYWPAEDAAGSSQLASGLSGGHPMTFAGTPGLAQDTTFACSAPLPDVQSSAWSGRVTYAGTWTDNVVRFLFHEDAGTVPNGAVLLSVFTTGTVARADLSYSVGGGLKLTGYNSSGGTVFTSAVGAFGIDGGACRLSVNIRTTGAPGGDVTWEIEKYAIGDTSGSTLSGNVAGTLGAVTQVSVNPLLAALGSTVAGQITVQPLWDSLFDVLAVTTNPSGGATGPLTAWEGETAGHRFSRLCTENGVTPRVYGSPAVTAPMGAQAIDTLPNLLQTIEDTDRGLLYEPAEVRGVGYRTLAALCAQAPKLTLDYSLGQAGDQEASPVSLVSTEDDLFTVNWWTVSGSSGSSAQAILDDGSAMSISDPADGGLGPYQNSKDVVTFADSQLQGIAGWMLHVSVVNEPRYASVVAGLHNPAVLTAGLGAAILGVRPGDLVQVINPPAWLPPGPVRALAAGTGMKITTQLTQAAWNTVPASPYDTGVCNQSGLVLDADSAVLASASLTTTATSLLVNNTGGELWSKAGGDVPFNVTLTGEEITVTAVADGLDGGPVTSPGSFANIVFLSGVASGTYTVRWSVTLAGTLSGTEVNNFALYHDSTFVTSSVNPAVAGTYPQKPVTLTVSAGVIKILTNNAGTTGSQYSAAIINPQAFTVTRSVNGVVKAHTGGEAVSVTTAAIVTLI